jgi:cytochrome P450
MSLQTTPDQGDGAHWAAPSQPEPGLRAAVTPGPAGIVSLEQNGDPLKFLAGLIERYGDVTRYQTKFGPCFLFIHPEHVQTILHRENYRRASLVQMMLGDGLLASDGRRWRSQRRLMQKDFLPPSVAPFVTLMAHETRRIADHWRLAQREHKHVDITRAMTRLTLRIVVQALFSEGLDESILSALCEAVTQTITDMGRISWTIFGVPVEFAPGRNAAFSAGKEVIDSTCYGLIARRRSRKPSERPRDLLTLLIEADTETGPMDDRQLRDELVTMLVGGHETTALALAWAWKVLADNPAVAANMHREIDHVLAGRDPDVKDLPHLPYTAGVFQETMRLYPPVWYMARVANEDDVVHGHAIPGGSCVLVSQWFTHRHKSFWTDPEKFDPTRFADRRAAPRHRYAYFPFGGGRHQCLGIHFSMLEGTLILAQLAQQFEVRPLPGELIEPNPGITLRQKPLMRATIALRSVDGLKAS